MFRVQLTCFIEDTKLAKLHWALNGLVYDLKLDAQPVANAVGKRGKVVDATGGGDIIDILRRWLKDNKKTVVNAKDAKAFQEHIGRSPLGYSSLLNRAMKAGVIRKSGKGTKTGYKVLEG